MTHIHPAKPIIDGICFDDTHGMDIEHINLLARREIVFVTDLKAKGECYCGKIIAKDWKTAEEIAFGRGLNETVIGVLSCVISADDMRNTRDEDHDPEDH